MERGFHRENDTPLPSSVRLIHGNCRKVIKTLDGIDAVVTDPPYGVGYGVKYKGGLGKYAGVPIVGDDKPFDPARLLRFPVVVLWGANHYADKLPPAAKWLVWDKREKNGGVDFADCELAWTNSDKPARVFRHVWCGGAKASERGYRVHPTQKPVALMKWCLDIMGIPKGATVLDPYMGSGSTGVACVMTGRNFIGIEIDEEYYRTAERRIKGAPRRATL